MRIGIITGEFPPLQGGIGAYSRILAEHLAAQGDEVFVLTDARANDESRTIHVTNTISRWDGRAWLAARAWAREQRLDVINLQYQTAAYAMSPHIHFLPDVLRPIPVVTTFHDLRYPYLFPKAGRLREWIVMRLARRSAGVIATNHEDLQRLDEHPRHVLIPIGSNISTALPDEYDRLAWREKAGADRDDFLIGYFGLTNHSKGLDVLLRALALLRDEDRAAKLVIVGGTAGASDPTNAAYTEEIDALIRELDLTNLVHVTGYVDERNVSAYLHAADALALPYRDGASYRRGSLMAGLAFGRAIVTTQPSVEIPAFVDGENMLIVPPEDDEALVTALRRLCDDDVLRERLRCGARETARLFDWDTIARDHAAFFRRVLEQPR